MKLTAPERFALEVLKGCPDGATPDALYINREISPATLYRLVELSLAHAEQQTLRTGMKVWRFRISEKGQALVR